MSKQEFTDGLRRSLYTIQDYTYVNDTISYYENYIEAQIRMGKTEEEVMQELGDPRLIAKSILATYESEDEEEDGFREYEEKSFSGGSQMRETVLGFNGKRIRMPSWLAKTLGILLLIAVLFVMITVLSWLAPYIFLGVIAYIVYKAFFGKY